MNASPNRQQSAGFSFIIPFYDCTKYLQRAIGSVRHQPGDDWELLLVDDGSTDRPEALLEPFLQDPRIRLIQQDNAGPGAARNRGAAAARGDWLWFLDCDDELLSGALEKVRRFAREHPEAKMIVGGHHTHDGTESKIRRPPELGPDQARNFRDFIDKKSTGGFSHGAVVVRRELFTQVRYPEEIRNNEDLVFHAQVLALYPCAAMPEALVTIHSRPDSLRHSLGEETLPEQVTRLLFDPALLPDELMPLQATFLANRRLSRFRRLAREGRCHEARRLYAQTIQEHPAALLRASYLRKFLRCLWR